MHSFATALISWQREHGRHGLPWQGGSAYRVWLSEIMLQQTQVVTVIPYYQRFIASFPTISSLAAASEEQVLSHWSGLGYYARGRNLHRAAQIIVSLHEGEFPQQYEQILALPGIGRSTAAAICAQAYQQRYAILDGNVKRVLARYCGISGSPSIKSVENKLWQQAEVLLPHDDIEHYTQALMDMGALLCTRNKPQCGSCPVQGHCIAFLDGRIGELPTPRPRKTLPEKQATLVLLMHGNDILLEKRAPQGIWGGLWCLPQFDNEATASIWCKQQGLNHLTPPFQSDLPVHSKKHFKTPRPFTHTFTHFKLHITPKVLHVASKPPHTQSTHIWLDVDAALSAAIPTPLRKLLKEI